MTKINSKAIDFPLFLFCLLIIVATIPLGATVFTLAFFVHLMKSWAKSGWNSLDD